MSRERLEFRILGPLEVRNGEQIFRLGAPKQRALLGVLLLHANEAVSTSHLVDELWGEQPPATAEKLVQGYVHALRKQLGPGVLETQPPGYRLNVEPRSLDLLEFERLTEEARGAPPANSVELRRKALSLWRGTALADISLEGSERHTVARLSEVRLATQIERIDAELQLGRDGQLVGELEALLAEHPYQERAAALLMVALYRSGRQAEALDVYRNIRRRLNDELGLQPGQELRDVEAAILRQDDRLAPPDPQPAATAPTLAAPAGGSKSAESTPTPSPVAMTRRTVIIAAAVGVAAVPAAAAFVWLRREPSPMLVGPDSVAVIDVERNRVVDGVSVGIRPGPIAADQDAVWVANLDDKSLSRIDPRTKERLKNVPLPATPDAIAVGGGTVWVANGRLGTLYSVDPGIDGGRLTAIVPVGNRSIFPGAGVDVAGDSVWAVLGNGVLTRVDPNLEPARATGLGETGFQPAGVVAAFDSVWVSNSAERTVQRFDPATFEEGAIDDIPVGKKPTGLAAGHDAVWVVCTASDQVARIGVDAAGYEAAELIRVGSEPKAIAVGGGAIWVANAGDGTASRIDPDRRKVEQTVEVGDAPSGIVFTQGHVWVTVQAR